MNEADGKIYQMGKRGGVYDKKDTSALHNGCLPASTIKAISLNLSAGFFKTFVSQELRTMYNNQKKHRTSEPGT